LLAVAVAVTVRLDIVKLQVVAVAVADFVLELLFLVRELIQQL
tara:strand:- start:427 stop:555 length:129 start_codon:yes stop_codon:yes gene_type:complete